MEAKATARNVALVGSSGSGKTTLLESMLFAAGAIGRKGSVADGTTVGDGSAESRARQMSTEVSAAGFAYQGLDFTVLDCPGSIEFVQEAYSAVLGCDAAVVVVEPVLERMIVIAPLLQFLDSHAIPHFVFVNKMDRAEVRYQDILQTLRQISARPVVPHQYAIGAGEDLVGYIDLITEEAHAFRRGQASDVIPVPPEHLELEQAVRREMLETLADFDDDLLELLLEDKEPSQELILGDLRKTLGADQVVPVFLGVADQDMGVRRLLEALAHEAPEPLVRVASLGLEAEGPPIVQVLKNLYLPHAGKLSLVRVWRGSVRDGTTFGDMRVGGVYRLFGSQQQNVGSAEAGEIVALARLDGARTGAALGANEGELPRPPAPRPMYAFAVSAVNRADEVKLSGAFAKLTDEDPALLVEHARETHQTLLWGQGEIHLRVALERLKNKYNVEVEPQAPRTPYRESIRKGVQAHGRHKKQSGGHGQFGDVKIEIRPLGRGEGFQFENKIVGGTVPRQFIPAVETGAREYLQRGPLGFPVVDIAVTLNDGQFHSVDSNELSFKLASAQALKEGLPQCEPVLLEPILSVTISVPADYTAKALQLVSGKRGQILGYAAKPDWSGWDEIEAQIPQGEMHDLIVTLRSLSQGTGFFDWAYDHLQEVPDRLAQTIVDKHRDLAA
ncbi:MAG: elongation factor G [Geminicoccaceae bacterium]